MGDDWLIGCRHREQRGGVYPCQRAGIRRSHLGTGSQLLKYLDFDGVRNFHGNHVMANFDQFAKHGGLWLAVWILAVAAFICFATVAMTLRDGPF
jgi:hypothetical protein